MGDSGAMPPVPLVVGVTGHRDLVAEEIPLLTERIDALLASLTLPDLPVLALSSLAEGADRLFAHRALARGIPLVAVLPMPREMYLQDFNAAGSREEFDQLLACAEVIELPLGRGVSAAAEGLPRDRQYAAAGAYVAGHCQVLVALWEGRESRQLGGTADIVRRRIEGRLAADGAEDSGALLADNENDLVFHIACSRDRPEGRPAHGLAPGETAWITDDPITPRTAERPASFAKIVARMAEFNRDWQANAEDIAAQRWSLLGSEAGLRNASIRRLDEVFGAADWLANVYQRRVQRALKLLYLLAAGMGLAFVLYSDLYQSRVVLWFFLALFALGMLAHRRAEKEAWHRRYLDYRALAEGLRVQVYWTLAGLSNPVGGRYAHDNFLQKQDIELSWIRNVMRAAAIHPEAVHAVTSTDDIDWVVHEWVGDEEDGQVAYFQRRATMREAHHRSTERLGRIALVAGILAAMVLAVAGGWFPANWHDGLLFTVGALTLTAGVREAYAFRKADRELIRQYRFMHRIFDTARRRLAGAAYDSERRAILRALGDAALDEHAEWIMMHRERPLEHGRP